MTNNSFELAGIRKTETVISKSKKKWYEGKPVVSAVILILIILGCLGAELIMTKDPAYMDLLNYNKAPNAEFLFGTDTMGRDIFSMIWYGGRISILIGGLATVISTFIAVVVGAFSGVAPAWLDEMIMRFTEVFLSIPTLLLIILLQAILGNANILSLSFVIGVTSWTSIAKVVRTEVRQIRNSEYIIAAKCMGAGFFRVLWKHLVRNFFSSIMFMFADDTAYQYLKENNVDLFAERSEFDGEHGVMAYNRTLQRPGKANQIRPMEEWIVAVGKHPGIIAGSDWVRVQAMLDVNKSKSYRRPRSNVALLSGLLRCGECGDYMRPKLTNRRTADGELIYTYMCSSKERSHGTVCSMKNCNGNTLDAKIIEEIRKLSADKETLTRLLAQTKKVISGSKEGYDAELALLREKHAETEERIKRLVESLSVASDTSAKYVMEQIDELHRESETQQARLSELEALTEQSRMLHQEFAFHQEMIESFASAVDSATLEEKRRLLRTIVKKVVWDGKNAYVYLIAVDGEADFPPVEQPMYPLGEDSE